MIQQINLYQRNTRKPRPIFGAQHTVIVLAVLIGVLSVISAIGLRKTSSLSNGLELSQQRLHDDTTKIESLKIKHPEILVDSVLRQNLSDSQRMVASMQKVLDYLTDSESERTRGFSGYFEGLARQTVSKVWLSGLTVTDGGLHLKLDGSTLLPERVPKLFRLLKDEPAFRGKMFSRLVMEKSEGEFGKVNFSISTIDLQKTDHDGA